MEAECIFDFPLAAARAAAKSVTMSGTSSVTMPTNNADAHGCLHFAHPKKLLIARKLEEVRKVLAAAEAHALSGSWACGYVAYEASAAFDTALKVRTPDPENYPLAWFAIYDRPLAAVTRPQLNYAAASAQTQKPHSEEKDWQASVSRAQYDQHILSIRQAILDGMVYQINFTQRMQRVISDDILQLYATLWAAQGRRIAGASAEEKACCNLRTYCAYLDIGRWKILTASPELLFSRIGKVLTTRPMKGTMQRGRWWEEDNARCEELQLSGKNRAENLMIVDLLRNDLARVAEKHSVWVRELFSVERYQTLLQMTSTICASARPGTTLEEIFTAIFPCGSVTGAPKIKAMELIAERETTPRGLYCGAVGIIAPGGDCEFNVAIRSLVHDSQTNIAQIGTGGGIVWDSTAPLEYQETLLKLRYLDFDSSEFCLIETLRFDSTGLQRLDIHLARLAKSACYFGWQCDLVKIRLQLTQFLQSGALEQACADKKNLHERIDETQSGRARAARLRILFNRAGVCTLQAESAPENFLVPQICALTHTPVDSSNIWLYHKTTRREMYERAMSEHPSAFDVLLWNEKDELTEFTRGNVIVEIDNCLYTPARTCGLLDGCLRAELLAKREIVETRILRKELSRASHIWFINSLRGWVEVTIEQ